jgi:chromosome segregation ATPase
MEVAPIPAKLRLKAAAIEATVSGYAAEERLTVERAAALEAKAQAELAECGAMMAEYERVTNEMNAATEAADVQRRALDRWRIDCQEAASAKLDREYERINTTRQIREQEIILRDTDALIDQVCHGVERIRLAIMKTEDATARLQLERDTVHERLRRLTEDKKQEERHVGKLTADLDHGVKAKENALKALVAMQAVNQEMFAQIKEVLGQRDQKQLILNGFAQKKQDMIQQLQEAVIIRNRKAREVIQMKAKITDLKSLAIQRNLRLLDQTRTMEFIMNKLYECSVLYEKVKADRNRCLGLIQTSRQITVELCEQTKLLENSVDVLRKEFINVDTAVKFQKRELVSGFKRREATKCELRTAEDRYRDLQGKIDCQANDTVQMNRILQQIEDRINSQQRQYALHADDCANVQRRLIDKQDQLCMIYEQYNRHEEVMRRGEIALREREEELRLLNNQLNDFVRQMEILYRKLPQLRKCEAEINELRLDITRERKDVEDLTLRLEVPDQKERKRQYCGRDFSHAELDAKLEMYSNQLQLKTQHRYEAQILLREIDEKISEIKAEATQDATATFRHMEKGGHARAEAMALRRKKMAALSEIAVYQAQKDELQGQKDEIVHDTEEALARSARGELFDEQADKLFRMHERDIKTASAPRQKSVFESDDEDEEPRPGRQKFDAYPTADGLSRPYGAFPVFQPGAPAPNLRFFKKEGTRPVVV